MSAPKPGDVAMVNFGDREERAFWEGYGRNGDRVGRWISATCGESYAEPDDYRPLVVIDPEDREQVRRLLTAILDANDPLSPTGVGLAAALREFADPKPPKPEARPIVHAVMYRDYKIGSLCDSGAWGAATLFSMVTDDVTCPGCRSKLDGGGVS